MTKEKRLLIMQAYEEQTKGIQLEEVEIEKNNQQFLAGIRVGTKSGPLGIVIYWEDMERAIGKDAAVDEGVVYIEEMVKRHLAACVFSEDIHDWKKMKPKVRKKVVNYNLNSSRLENVVCRPYFDLAEVLYLTLEMPGGQGSCEIQKRFLEYWGVSEDELFWYAGKNMEGEHYRISCLADLLPQVSPDMEKARMPLLFGTNRETTFGAALMTEPKLLKRLLGEKDGDYYILPSSIHEIILYPDDGVEAGMLRDMVHEVNRTVVLKQDFLSDSVYYYHAESGTVTVCG